jgi:hypothetical protein
MVNQPHDWPPVMQSPPEYVPLAAAASLLLMLLLSLLPQSHWRLELLLVGLQLANAQADP